MKRIFSFVLAALMLVSAVPTTFATNDYTAGTKVEYTASGSEGYTITVPALLAPGDSGTVTLSGTWADNRTVIVTADKDVTLVNSINENDTKVLDVTFNGIRENGNNTESQTFTEPVSVEDITNAIFGTWSGKFNYNVQISDVPILEGSGQTFYTLTPSELTFRSTAPLNEFQEVRVNGQVIDPSNYTLTEGSTIVTLKTDYLHTLSEADYKIEVVSNSGSPAADFDVIEQTINDQFFYYDVPYMFVDEEGNITFSSDMGGFMGIMMQEDGRLFLVGVDGSLRPGVEIFTYDVEGNVMTCSNGLSGVISTDGTKISVPDVGDFMMTTQVAMSEGEYFYIYGEFFGEFFEGPFVLDKHKTTYDIPLYNINGKALPFDYSFEFCEEMTSITLPFGAEQIGDGCFLYCDNLQKIIIPSTVKSIKDNSFTGCYALTDIQFNGTIEQWNNITKSKNWSKDIPATQVVCTDGVVILK